MAYADFVTAMMALFMVLWISAQNREIVAATARYFQNPFRAPTEATSGVLPYKSEKARSSSSTPGDDTSQGQDRKQKIQLTFLSSVAADFYRLLHLDESLESKPIDISVTTEGLKLTLYDRASQPMFVGDTAEFTEWGSYILQTLAWTIDRHKFHVAIDGHTKAGIVPKKEGYTSWELSADRANGARRLLELYAVEPEMIERVAGFAATRPLLDKPPASDANQRLTISLTLTAKSRLSETKIDDNIVPPRKTEGR